MSAVVFLFFLALLLPGWRFDGTQREKRRNAAQNLPEEGQFSQSPSCFTEAELEPNHNSCHEAWHSQRDQNLENEHIEIQTFTSRLLKDVRANCFCASLLRTQFTS